MNTHTFNQFRNSILGFVIGDALGVPFEFKNRKDLLKNPCTDMIGHGTHNQPIGTWSDDTSMMLILMQWISDMADKYTGSLENVSFDDYVSLKKDWQEWLRKGYMTPHGVCFDSGLQTRDSLRNPDLLNEACLNPQGQGNGSLMRVLPFAFLRKSSIHEFIMNVTSNITHANVVCNQYCAEYINDVRSALRNDSFIVRLDDSAPNSSGWVVDTYNSVYYVYDRFVCEDLSFKDALCLAVNLGDDTDTIGALTGGLIGATLKEDQELPKDWLEKIVKLDMIEEIILNFWNKTRYI